jgi:hypothetical protein
MAITEVVDETNELNQLTQIKPGLLRVLTGSTNGTDKIDRLAPGEQDNGMDISNISTPLMEKLY